MPFDEREMYLLLQVLNELCNGDLCAQLFLEASNWCHCDPVFTGFYAAFLKSSLISSSHHGKLSESFRKWEQRVIILCYCQIILHSCQIAGLLLCIVWNGIQNYFLIWGGETGEEGKGKKILFVRTTDIIPVVKRNKTSLDTGYKTCILVH